jgi:hypothetical protein
MSSLKKSLFLTILIMVLIYLSLSVIPDISKLNPPKQFISSPADCYKVSGSVAYGCITGFAIERKNAEICAGIDNAFYRDDCYLTVYKGKQDLAFCQKLSFPQKRGECFAKLALDGGGLEACSGAVLGEGSSWDEASDQCFSVYATSSGNREACVRIGDVNRARECVYGFALLTNNPEDCNSKSEDAKEYCRMQFVISSKNAGECPSLSQPFSDQCAMAIALAKHDPKDCIYIKDQALADTCDKQTR